MAAVCRLKAAVYQLQMVVRNACSAFYGFKNLYINHLNIGNLIFE